MKKHHSLSISIFLFFTVLFCVVVSSCQTSSLMPYRDRGWVLIWSDEFDGDSLDTTKWNIETGTGIQYGEYIDGWGNREAQYYRAENVTVRDGMLVLEARKENFGGRQYTSARVSTGAIKQGSLEGGNTFPLKYELRQPVRIEVRARTPRGVGFWPAIWLIGAEVNEYGPYTALGWPRCGEIDIMEVRGGQENILLSTIHYGEEFGVAKWSRGDQLELPFSLADDWNVFGVAWDHKVMHFLLNGEVWHTIIFEEHERPRANLQAFYNEEGFVINMNLAVGGNFLNRALPADSAFAAGSSAEDRSLMIDWVRVYGRQR